MPRAYPFGGPFHYEYQPVATVSLDPPVQNTWYELLPTTRNVRVDYVVVKQVNDETNAKAIEWRITIDGNVIIRTGGAFNNNTFVHLWRTAQGDFNDSAALHSVGGADPDLGLSMFGLSVKIEIRMTAAPGTNQTLDGYCVFHKLEATYL